MLGSVVILIGVVAMGAAGHLLLREGMLQVGRVGTRELQQPLDLAVSIITNPLILVALPMRV